MKTTLLLGAGLGACLLAWAAKDPVIMTVNGVDVPKSEFEYLYHKNSQQQLSPQPIDEYVDMFVNYRLKVADAIADGIDTTASFRQEMAQYRHDLAAPYMTDSVFLDNLVKEAYDRSREEVEISHIMLFKNPSPEVNARSRATLDSLCKEIAAGTDFAVAAMEYSQDRGSKSRGGSMGYVSAGRLPYGFEKAAFALRPGEVSEVVESPVGYHIIKSGNHRPARGTVRVSHILLLDQNNTPDQSAAIKERIDSIYEVVSANPSKFEEMAIRFSDDKGSARQGGMLQWFGSGMMVQEFDSASFALPVGEISRPVRTQYGWHIINKLDRKDPPTLEEMRGTELARISNPQDERSQIVRKHQKDQLARKHKPLLNAPLLGELKEYAGANGIDSLFYAKYNAPVERDREVLKIGKKGYPLSGMIAAMHGASQPNVGAAMVMLDAVADNYEYDRLVEAEEEWLEANVADYRNLLHEYTNGSLLYEASLKNVWDKAAKDTEGLADYFAANRKDYAWNEPRAKGILVQAKNDSIAADIVRRYAEIPAEEAVVTLKKEYKGEASIDRVLLQKGQNAIVDNLMFGEGEAISPNANYSVCFMLDGRLIDAPEDVNDVRGQATSDYQESLEAEWVKQLRRKYPVEINKKVLGKVR